MYQKINLLIPTFDVKSRFDAFLVSTSGSGFALPNNLKNFAGFQQLEMSAAVKALQENIVSKTENIDILGSVHWLMLALVSTSGGLNHDLYVDYVHPLSRKLKKLKNGNLSQIDAFIEGANKVLAEDNPLLEQTFLEEISALVNVIEKAGKVYSEQTLIDKDALAVYLKAVSSRVTNKIDKIIAIIFNNNTSEKYAEFCNFLGGALQKILKVKGIRKMFPETFYKDTKEQAKYILSIKDTDEFLTNDFSQPTVRKREILILNLLENSSAVISKLSMKEIINYYYQIHVLRSNKAASDGFKKEVNKYDTSLREKLLAGAKNFKLEDNTDRSILLTIIGVIFSDLASYDSFDKNTKFKLQASLEKICEKYGESVCYMWFYFCAEILGYFSIFEHSGATLERKIERIKKLSEKLIAMKALDDAIAKYLIQEVTGKLLEYFIKQVATLVSVSFKNEFSIEELSFEELSSLAEKIPKEKLPYLEELKNFCEILFEVAQSFSSKFKEKEVVENFMKAFGSQLKVFKEKEKRLSVSEKIKTTITHFRFDACCPYEILSPNGKPKYCFSEQYNQLFESLEKTFPNLCLDLPESWEKILKKVFSPEDLSLNPPLIFMVGFICQKNADLQSSEKASAYYRLALKFYSYCLEKKFWEDPQTNKNTILITKEIIERRIKHCKEVLSAESIFQKQISSSSTAIPVVFQNASVPVQRTSDVGINAEVNILPRESKDFSF